MCRKFFETKRPKSPLGVEGLHNALTTDLIAQAEKEKPVVVASKKLSTKKKKSK